MDRYIINGGNKLFGEIEIQGCKNSALAILIACLTVDGEIILSNIPDISDVRTCLEILEYYGCQTEFINNDTVKINTKNIESRPIPKALTLKMRASSYLLGALLSRFGKCELPESGGCNFGTRPINLHIDALKALGASENGDNGLLCTASGLKGSVIRFPSKTVGGTVNAIIAAAKANGTTVIYNAAREPHITDLARFLSACGADISGVGSDTLTVKGVQRLSGCEYAIDTDMIEAGTYMIAALATKGRITCKNAPIKEMDAAFSVLKRMGADISCTDSSATVSADRLFATDTVTEPYPGFPTDLQPQITALCGLANGISHIHETVFENRFLYLNELKKCGLDFTAERNILTVNGIKEYCPAELSATDLRGGAALVIAALNASGQSTVSNIGLIERGYSDLDGKLASIGADIVKL